MSGQIDRLTMTYVLTTRNKLPYFREQISHLLENVEPDDEIVVADGGSTDGTAEYLAELLAAGKINQYVSEPDKCEGHGANKGLLLARGDLIKVLTDDDIFDWAAIKAAKRFMMEHPEIDVLSGNIGYAVFGSIHKNIVPSPQYQRDFVTWLSTGRPFGFTGLALLIRRTSLPLLGLFHTGISTLDHEYAFRVSLVGNVAWYTALCAVRVHNPGSTYQFDDRRYEGDRNRIFRFYGYKPTLRRRLLYLRLKLMQLQKELAGLFGVKPVKSDPQPEGAFQEFYKMMYEQVCKQNTAAPGKFLYRGMPEP